MKPGGVDGTHLDGTVYLSQDLFIYAQCIKSVGFASVTSKSKHILEGQKGVLRLGAFGYVGYDSSWHYGFTSELLQAFALTRDVASFFYSTVYQLKLIKARGIPMGRTTIKRRLHLWHIKSPGFELMFYELALPTVTADYITVKLVI